MADTHETINCPACGAKMRKIFISDTGINVDICLDGCGGIYFDNREFRHFDEHHEALDEILQAAENNTFSVQVDENAIRICPNCGSNMVKNPTSVKGEVIIDECYGCGSKFLDHGELTKIRAEYVTEKERSEAAIKALLYSPEGAEVGLSAKSNKLNEKMYKINHDFLGKLINKIMDK